MTLCTTVFFFKLDFSVISFKFFQLQTVWRKNRYRAWLSQMTLPTGPKLLVKSWFGRRGSLTFQSQQILLIQLCLILQHFNLHPKNGKVKKVLKRYMDFFLFFFFKEFGNFFQNNFQMKSEKIKVLIFSNFFWLTSRNKLKKNIVLTFHCSNKLL